MANLRDLGLSEYESRAYRSLLNTGPATAKELSRASDVPMGRVYDVLNSLEQYELVRSQASGRPKKYIAVEPETALDRLVDDRKRELEEKIDHYEQVAEELVEEFDATDPVDEQFWTAVVGREDSRNLLLERLGTADERIVMVASHRVNFDFEQVGVAVTDKLQAALDRDVKVEVLMTRGLVDSLPEAVGDAYRESLSSDPRFSVRVTDSIRGSFNLIDSEEVCIQVPDPVEARQLLAMIHLKDPVFTAEVEQEVRPRWERAEPLSL